MSFASSHSPPSHSPGYSISPPPPHAHGAPSQPAPLEPLNDNDDFGEFKQEDWDDDKTYGASLGTTPDKRGKAGIDKLWDDEWDNDDVSDEFSQYLRKAVLEQHVKDVQAAAAAAAAGGN